MTNADIIRNMTDEELVSILQCPYDKCKHFEEDDFYCCRCVSEWLQSEVKDGDSV